jgi:hypothetical protein
MDKRNIEKSFDPFEQKYMNLSELKNSQLNNLVDSLIDENDWDDGYDVYNPYEVNDVEYLPERNIRKIQSLDDDNDVSAFVRNRLFNTLSESTINEPSSTINQTNLIINRTNQTTNGTNQTTNGTNSKTDLKKFESINGIIEKYMENPTDTLRISNQVIDELPEIMRTLTKIKIFCLDYCGLKSLKNLPPNVKFLEIKFNQITEVKSCDIPQSVEELNMNKNSIQNVDLFNSPHIKKINLSNNPLTGNVALPPNLVSAVFVASMINTTTPFKNLKYLKSLNINSTDIINIDDLPEQIEELYISRLSLDRINYLPPKLHRLVAHSSGISEFCFEKFPDSLKNLDIYDNNLTSLPKMSSLMNEIDLMKNYLQMIDLPSSFSKIDMRDNDGLVLTKEQKNILEIFKKTYGDDSVAWDDYDENIQSPLLKGFGENDLSNQFFERNLFDKKSNSKSKSNYPTDSNDTWDYSLGSIFSETPLNNSNPTHQMNRRYGTNQPYNGYNGQYNGSYGWTNTSNQTLTFGRRNAPTNGFDPMNGFGKKENTIDPSKIHIYQKAMADGYYVKKRPEYMIRHQNVYNL